MTSLIIGYGEVGKGLHKVIGGDVLDQNYEPDLLKSYDIIHVCFPYSEQFIKEVKKYQKEFKPKVTVIHSTVPVGTSKKCNAVHSYIRGIHPNIDKGIKTFVKFFGGKDAKKVANYFKKFGVETYTTKKSGDTEMAKLVDTLIYGLNIMIEKEVYKLCKDNKLNFDLVYTLPNKTYNEGYAKLGRPEYSKYILKHVDGPIKGHCVIPNLELMDFWLADLLKERNKNY